MQNSFGSGWNPGPVSDRGRNGRIWWDYDAFFKTQGYASIAFPAASAAQAWPARGATTLQSDDPGAPQFTVSHATADALTLTGLHVRGRSGRAAGVSLNETMRLGCQYVTRRGGARLRAGHVPRALHGPHEGGQDGRVGSYLTPVSRGFGSGTS